MASKRSRRSISDQEVALIRAMLKRAFDKTTVQAYFTHPDRRVNFGRITDIERDDYGRGVTAATDDELDKFLAGWRDARGAPIQDLAEAAVDLSALSPVDPTRVLSLFELAEGSAPRLRDGETEEIECKGSFRGPNNDKLLRAIAALANNRGGHILFGVGDDPCEIVGLRDERFVDLDVSAFSMTIRSAMEPVPRFDVGHLSWEGKLVGVLYVHPQTEGPVIATKDVDTYRAGMIYYRYPGESRGIGPSEFRRILAERDKKVRTEAAELARKVVQLGDNAAVVDLSTGKMEGRSGALYLSPDLLPKLRFIREGQFKQTDGAATLRLIGDVTVTNTLANEIVRERIVRQSISDADVLRNFLSMEKVEYPAEYILHGCHTGKRYLPLFYYARQSGLTAVELSELIGKEETTQDVSRGLLLDRVQGRLSARKPVSLASHQLTQAVRNGTEVEFTALAEVRKTALALQGFRDTDVPLEKLLALLRKLAFTAREFGTSDPAGSEIRRASAWIDELYFGQSFNASAEAPPR